MPRPTRLEFRGAIHYTTICGSIGGAIFFDQAILQSNKPPLGRSTADLRKFEQLIIAACKKCQMVLHAYCVEPNSATLVLQTAGAPLEAFMRRICGQYSRYLRANGRLVGPQRTFAARYQSKIIAPEYLPHAVRRAHRAPIVSGYCRSPLDYPFSSDRIFSGEAGTLPIDVSGVGKALKLRGLSGHRGYRTFMDQPETPYVAALFDNGAPQDPRIVGGKLFVQQTRFRAAHPLPVPTREQIITSVALLINLPANTFLTHSHAAALGRALVAWYALRYGTATLTKVGQWFSVTGATLSQGILHYQRVAPHLFELDQLPSIEHEKPLPDEE